MLKALVLVTAFSAAATAAAAGSACVAPGPVTHIGRLSDLPAPVRRDLGVIADVGQPFQVTDVLTPGRTLPGRRFDGADRVGRLVAVHYEAGGVAHDFEIAVYELSPDGRSARLVRTVADFPMARGCPWGR